MVERAGVKYTDEDYIEIDPAVLGVVLACIGTTLMVWTLAVWMGLE